jgi:hypothetical protein
MFGDCLVRAVLLKNYRSIQLFLGYFAPRKKCVLRLTKMVWASSWAIFFKTDLVALLSATSLLASVAGLPDFSWYKIPKRENIS